VRNSSNFETYFLMECSLINPLSTEYEVAHCLDVAQPEFLAADASTRPTLHAAAKRQGLVHLTSISVDDTSGSFAFVSYFLCRGMTVTESL
jgi:hypothetical protein